MARVCDHIVALDGRYALYPDQRLQSGLAEVQAIIDTARSAGCGMTLHTAPRTFKDEMEKRTMLFKLGALEARTELDWFFILDGDEVLIECPPKQEVTGLLAATSADVVAATLFEKTDPHQDEWRTDLGMKLQTEWRYECRTPRLWRALNDMRVVGYHFNYVGERSTGETVELWGMDGSVDRAEWASLCGKMIIENRNRLRGKQRDADREAYYKDRDELGIETIAPLAELEGEKHVV
jgi:hypothetical protein